jgi:hypothetical protein
MACLEGGVEVSLRFFPGGESLTVYGDAERLAGPFEDQSGHGPESKGRTVIDLQEGYVNEEQAGADAEGQRFRDAGNAYRMKQAGGDAILTVGGLDMLKGELH